MNAASSDAKNTTAFAMSAATPSLPSGCKAMTLALTSFAPPPPAATKSSITFWPIIVSMTPG